MGLVFFLAARPFAMLFTRNPEVIEIAVSYLRIMAVSEPLLGVGMVLTGALHGAGDTLRPTLLTAATFWGIRIPLAWWLALAMGYQSTGAWLAMALSTCVGGVVTALLFRGGRWKTVRV
jgi:Na+-driven multidrug efflux pump